MSREPNRYINPDRVMLGENTRKEVRQALQSGRLKAAIVPIGAIEQHNEHLALNVDIVVSTFLSRQAALQLYPQVVVAPGCPVGYSPYHMAREGTLTLRKETLRAYLFDVVQSLKTHGIATILVVNGHGGNHGLLRDVLPEWRRRLGVVLDEVSYASGLTDEERADILQGYRDLREGRLDTVARQTALNHASEEETSLVLAICPQRVRAFTLEEYDQAGLDYARELSPEVEEYLEPFSKEGWPRAGPNPENPRDRARQENALFASVEKGEVLIACYSKFIAEKLQGMIDGAEGDSAGFRHSDGS